MASTIYGATLKTNFTIKERHISQHRPAYIPRGREASVKVEEDHDLVFVNVNSSNYELQTEVTNGNLVARWVGYPLPDEYEVAIKDAQTLDPRTVVHYSTEVYQTQVKQEGSSGEVYKLYRTINGESATKLITEDYYSPVNRIEVRYQPVESSDSSSNNNSDSDSSDDDSNSNDDSTDGSNNGDDTGDSNSTSGNDGSDGTNDDTSTDSTNDNQDDSNDVIQDPEDIWDISDGPSKGE
nr:VanW family protein [Pontibacillus yanchengensis]